MWRAIFVLLAIINIAQNVEGDGMIEVFQWNQMDFYNRGTNGVGAGNAVGSSYNRNRNSGAVIFPAFGRKKRATTSRDDPPIITQSRFHTYNINRGGNTGGDADSYIAYNNVPMGANHYNGRLFVTMPRRRVGIPSTLNYVDMRRDGNNKSPKLHAYPDFETNYLNPHDFTPNPNRIISVYRTTVDACKRLWFIDTGMLEYPANRTQVQRPSIWIMDLSNDRVIRRFDIPEAIVRTGQGLASITVNVDPKRCDEAYAYIPDLVNSQLYVYSFGNNRMWAFSHNYFNFDPLGGDLSVGGQEFRWDDGIFSTTLGPIQANGTRNVYFHAMASFNEFVVSSDVLNNEANAARSDHGRDFNLLGSRGAQRQSTMHAYDPRTAAIFYAEIQRNGVGCWDTKKPFSADNHGTVIQDAERMIYPSDLTIDEDGTMWVMSNSMPIFIYSELDTNVVNFRIWKQNVAEAVKNTVCQ